VVATVAPTAVTWTWPKDVLALAAELGVSDYLQPVFEMTRHVYRSAPLTVQIDEDPEIPNDRRILLEVDVTGWDVPHLVDAQNRWSTEVFDHCPSTHVRWFRLSLAANA
jgi:hypothetical protein